MKLLGLLHSLRKISCLTLILSFWQVTAQVPACPEITAPEEGVVDVPLDFTIEWEAVAGATGYQVTIGSSSGNNDIVDDFDVGNVLFYQLPGGFEILTSVFLTVTAYNAAGVNTTCSEFRFTTTSGEVPRCTQIINPQDGASLVPVNANITWIRDFTALGYLMTIREKEPDGAFLLNREDVGNGTNFKPPNFKPRTNYYVTLIPYNSQGLAVDCEAIVFTTGDPLPLPDCATLVSPRNGGSNVLPNVSLEWNEVPNVDGYFLSVGTSAGSADIVNREDVGSSLNYDLSEDLPLGATIYVRLETYKGDEISVDCPLISFTIEGPDIKELSDDIPKFFTPNNDGFNDTWIVKSTEDIQVQQVSIFNRFGKLVKQLAPNQSWDGTQNGRNLPSDSYWFSIELLNAPQLKGYFLLKR